VIAAVRNVALGLRARLRERPDTEHEQALVRLAVGTFFFFYLLPRALIEPGGLDGVNHQFLAVMVSFLVVSAGIFVSILINSGASPVRRLLGAVLDAAAVTYFMCETGGYGIPLFLVYVWTTLGNGFRYGPFYLLSSLVLNGAGFAVVLWLSPFWQAYIDAGIGMLVGMVALSLYVLTLVKRMFDALSRAEAANQAKRRFISVVSHEMRTPLNAIIGMSDLLRESTLNREQVDMVQTMGASSRLLLRLVEDVLDFSKIESGKLTVEQTEFDLHALVNSASRILQTQAEARGLELRVSIMPEVSPALRGDPHHLRQVLINLIGNAVKFTERGSVTVHVSLLTERDDAIRVKFSVRDTGIGIPPEAQHRIFDSFVQADQSTTRRFGGTGLGTTIAKQLVELMGGTMGLESAVGLGSTFWFELELQKQPVAEHSGAGELADARVLMVGFPIETRETLIPMLHGWGGTAVSVSNVEEAALRLAAEAGYARPFHSVLVFARDAAGAQQAAATLRRGSSPPLLLCMESGSEGNAASVAHEQRMSVAGFAASLSLPVQKRLLFNALHSVSAVEEQSASSGVVQLRDYFNRRDQEVHYRIIVADDSATNRQVIGKILERGGHEVTLVEDGEDVLDALEAGEFDLVILDRNMPGMGGVETLRTIRVMNLGRSNLPVVVLSADVTSETRDDCLRAGADAFLPKPVEAIRLLDAVVELCGGVPVEKRPAHPAANVANKVVTSPPMSFAHSPAGSVPMLNLETLQLLEGLGSQNGFLERLIKVFVSDNLQLLERMERCVPNRDFAEFRRLLHAMKGSAASIGAEQLALICSTMNGRTDAEMALQSKLLVGSIQQEFEAARAELDRYIADKRRTTG